MHFWKDWSVFSGCGSCPARSPIGTSLHPNMNIRTNEKQEKRHSRFSCFREWGNHRLCQWRCPVKSFSFKHRAKRAANSKLSVKKDFR